MARTSTLLILPLLACGSPAVVADAGDTPDADQPDHVSTNVDASKDAPSSTDAITKTDAPDPVDDSGTIDEPADDSPVVVVTDGGACTINAQCQTSDYCAKSKNDCSGSGSCVMRPVICPQTYIPVCSCTGITYDNDCNAHAAGENVLKDGPC
jgi:hypothetical protein